MGVEMGLFRLEVGNAITQQAADAVVLFAYGYRVAGARQLLGEGQAGGPRAHDGYFLAGLPGGRLRCNPALGPTLVDNGVFYRLDADGVVIDVKRTGGLAGGGADAAGELREIIRGEIGRASCRERVCQYV